MFPSVLFVLLRGMKTELGPKQILVLSLVSVSVFSVTYGLAAALCFAERKNRPPAGSLIVPKPLPPVGRTINR